MQKLTKADLAARDALVAGLATRYAALEDAITDFNTQQRKAWAAVKAAQASYNDRIGEANTWMEGIAGDIEVYMAVRSEPWHDRDQGQAYEAWLEAFRLPLDEIDLDVPDELELLDGDGGAALPDLPEDVDLP
jgi:hypothetical protein